MHSVSVCEFKFFINFRHSRMQAKEVLLFTQGWALYRQLHARITVSSHATTWTATHSLRHPYAFSKVSVCRQGRVGKIEYKLDLHIDAIPQSFSFLKFHEWYTFQNFQYTYIYRLTVLLVLYLCYFYMISFSFRKFHEWYMFQKFQ